MIQLLLTILLSLPAYHHDAESPDERAARMLVVAQSIDAATLQATCEKPFNSSLCEVVWPGKREELAALLVTIGYHESAFARPLDLGERLAAVRGYGLRARDSRRWRRRTRSRRRIAALQVARSSNCILCAILV